MYKIYEENWKVTADVMGHTWTSKSVRVCDK